VVEIGFYHLTRTALPEALARLLGRTLQSGQRALVLCPDAARLKALDIALWACPDPVWLPHGGAADGDADLQPVWLSTEPDAANGARFLFLVDGANTDQSSTFDRVFDLFDGNDPDKVAAARERWRAAKDDGHGLTYWKQGPRGWEKGG
jgi:DNA polymerase III subunit chi